MMAIDHDLDAANDCPPFDDGYVSSIVDTAAEHQPMPAVDARPVSLAPTIPRFEIVDLTQPIPPVNYLIEELDIAAGAGTFFVGESSAGKTMVAMQMEIDLALDRLVWGRFRGRLGARSLHLNWDQGRWPTITRFQRKAAAAGVDLRAIARRLSVVNAPPISLDAPQAEDVMLRECEGYDLVVIDSWRAACSRTEENSSEARIPVDMCMRVSEKTGAVCLWIHHAGHLQKDAPKGRSKVRARGSSAFRDVCDSMFALSADKGEPTLVEHVKSRMKPEGPDFYLNIEDVRVGENPRAGLRVVHKTVDAVVPKREPSKNHEALVESIRRALRQHPDVPGKGALFGRMGGNKTAFTAAFAELEALGEVVNLGTYNQPRLRLKPRGNP